MVGCGVLASALCMDKDRAHRLVRAAGIPVPASFSLEPGFCQEDALRLAGGDRLSLFVKPVRAGSSYGVSKVYKQEHLLPAISAALRYDDRVLVEACINGSEVGCAVMGTHTLITGEIDQISLGSGFLITPKSTISLRRKSTCQLPSRQKLPRVSRKRQKKNLPGPGLLRLCPGGHVPHRFPGNPLP